MSQQATLIYQKPQQALVWKASMFHNHQYSHNPWIGSCFPQIPTRIRILVEMAI